MEKAGLLSIEARKGKKSKITLLHIRQMEMSKPKHY
jgi:hypothetical protein